MARKARLNALPAGSSVLVTCGLGVDKGRSRRNVVIIVWLVSGELETDLVGEWSLARTGIG